MAKQDESGSTPRPRRPATGKSTRVPTTRKPARTPATTAKMPPVPTARARTAPPPKATAEESTTVPPAPVFAGEGTRPASTPRRTQTRAMLVGAYLAAIPLIYLVTKPAAVSESVAGFIGFCYMVAVAVGILRVTRRPRR